ncbi:hypothetical protein ACN28S_61645 [Cystobacter fuscus]
MFYPRPEDHPAPFLTFAADVYGTGPMLLFLQLEELLPGGQEDVLRGIQHFLAAPGARSTQHLHESLEQGAHRHRARWTSISTRGSTAPTSRTGPTSTWNRRWMKKRGSSPSPSPSRPTRGASTR